MEPAKIDWKRIESIFEEDRLYENINAPKWVDFLATEESTDDEAWFCRPDCNHPKKAEDFLKITPISKLSNSANETKTSLSGRNPRGAKLKRRGQSQSSFMSSDKPIFSEDGENHNPNLSAPLNHQVKSMKTMIKSGTEKKNPIDDISQNNQAPRLKSTLSARNLFAGKDILNHITGFCSELKKMALRARQRENNEKLNEKKNQEGEKDVKPVNEGSREVLEDLDVKEKDRMPLLEKDGQKYEENENGDVKEKPKRKKRVDDAENIPVPMNLANVKHKGEEHLLQIRTNPPSPQCFSATRAPTKSAPSKSSKSRLMEKGILQEVKQTEGMPKEETEDKGRSLSIVEGREARAMDVFWFLKPCTVSS